MTAAGDTLATVRAIITYTDSTNNNQTVTEEEPVHRSDFPAANTSQEFEVEFDTPETVTDALATATTGTSTAFWFGIRSSGPAGGISRWTGSGPTTFEGTSFSAEGRTQFAYLLAAQVAPDETGGIPAPW